METKEKARLKSKRYRENNREKYLESQKKAFKKKYYENKQTLEGQLYLKERSDKWRNSDKGKLYAKKVRKRDSTEVNTLSDRYIKKLIRYSLNYISINDKMIRIYNFNNTDLSKEFIKLKKKELLLKQKIKTYGN